VRFEVAFHTVMDTRYHALILFSFMIQHKMVLQHTSPITWLLLRITLVRKLPKNSNHTTLTIYRPCYNVLTNLQHLNCTPQRVKAK